MAAVMRNGRWWRGAAAVTFAFATALPCAATRAQQPPRARVEIVVTWADGTPAAGVQLRMFPVGADSVGPLRARWRRTGDDGRAVFEDLPPGRWLCDGDRGGRSVVTIDAATGRVPFVVPAGVAVRGTVVDAAGQAVGDAAIWLSTAATTEHEGVLVGRTAADGTFALRDVDPDRLVRAIAPGHAPTAAAFVGTAPVTLCCDRGGRSVRGTVRDADGTPLGDAVIAVATAPPPPHAAWWPRDLRDVRPAPEARTDAAGRFELLGVPADCTQVWLGHEAFAVGCARLPEGDAELTVELQRPVDFRGTVRDGAGVLVAGALVSGGAAVLDARIGRGSLELPPARGGHTFRLPELLQPHFAAPEWAQWRTRTAADGSFAFAGLPPGHVQVVARGEHGVARWTGRSDAAVDCTLQLAPGTALTGALQHGDRGLDDWLVFAIPAVADHGDWLVASSGADGAFRIDGAADVAYDLFACPRTTSWLQLPPRGAPLATGLPADGPFELRVRTEPPTAFVEVDLQNRGGPLLGGAVLVFERVDGPRERLLHLAKPENVAALAAHRARVGPLPAGRWKVTAHWQDLAAALGVVDLTPGATQDLGVHVLR